MLKYPRRLSLKEKASMNRVTPWTIGGGVLLAAWGALLIMLPERKDPAFDFISGNRPVTEDEVRQKLISDGWTDVQIVLRGRFFMAGASKAGELGTFSVDALTGRLRGEDDDCDDPVYDDSATPAGALGDVPRGENGRGVARMLIFEAASTTQAK
jgi:hypothetical protein